MNNITAEASDSGAAHAKKKPTSIWYYNKYKSVGQKIRPNTRYHNTYCTENLWNGGGQKIIFLFF
jgi:hypothetical protein